MRDDFVFRKGKADDCGAVYHLICDMENRKLPFDSFLQIFEEQIGDSHYNCIVCEYKNTVIGVLNLRFERQLHHSEQIAEIMEFSINPYYRRKGIGQAMFIYACQVARSFGCIQIEVACNQLRADTHRFYLREGMHNFHFKFTMPLTGEEISENAIGY